MAEGPTQRDRQKEETRQRVFEAALEVFRRDGTEAARIDEIAALAGVSRGAFYFHFPSKDDVLVELSVRSQQSVVEEIAALGEAPPLSELLSAVADGVGRRWAEDPTLLAEMGVVALRRGADDLVRVGRSHPLQGALVPHFTRAQQQGEVGALIPAEQLCQFFLVNLGGAALAWSGNPVVPLQELLGNVVTFFFKAARPLQA